MCESSCHSSSNVIVRRPTGKVFNKYITVAGTFTRELTNTTPIFKTGGGEKVRGRIVLNRMT